MTTNEQNANLPRWACITLAVMAAIVGLASSGITAKFFILGLERLETDTVAREILIATGILMIVTELMAFGLVALLPKGQLRALRTKLIVCGVLLLGFETATIYITQVALLQTTEAGNTANRTRINDLRASIDNRRSAARSLRENGALQSASSNSWTRSIGAAALRDALQVEQQIDPLSAELASLESAAHPSMDTVIGRTGMLVYSVTRALLISVMGLVMFGAAGALLRSARNKPSTASGGTVSAKQGLKMPLTSTVIPRLHYSTSLPALASTTKGLVIKEQAAAPVQSSVKIGAKDHSGLPADSLLGSGVPSVHGIGEDPLGRGRVVSQVSQKRHAVLSELIGKGRSKKIQRIPGNPPGNMLLQKYSLS